MQSANNTWQKALAEGFASSSTLLQFLNLPVTQASSEAEQLFKTRVPRGFAACMEPGNPNDPLLRQVLAVHDELLTAEGFTKDPLDESHYNPLPGLIHKYKGRVLLTVTGVCAINCRYCFRRHFDYEGNNPGRRGWQAACAYIESDTSIQEVILSGGDPLLATDQTLQFLLDALSGIPHVHTVRIHTRLPVVLPERITPSLCHLLKTSRFQVAVVLHANHANELRDEVLSACVALRAAGCQLLNQSVLLSGVNDSADRLIALSQRLWACGVLPYYLHLLDKVSGTAHFDVALSAAKKEVHAMRAALPGYLVPRLVVERPGGKNKSMVY